MWNREGTTNFACSGAGTGSAATGNCGNGIIDQFEQCDFVVTTPTPTFVTPVLGGATCQTLGLGFTGGTLGCQKSLGGLPECGYDFSGCTTTSGCGDGIIEGVEQCDPPGSTATCSSIGLTGTPFGSAVCSATCDWNVGYCAPYNLAYGASYLGAATPVVETALCGDNIIEDTEQCDGTNLQGATFASLGYAGGSLICSGCHYDITGCTSQSGLVTVVAVGPNVTWVRVGDVVALAANASCNPFALNNYNTGRQQYCLVDQTDIAVSLEEGNLFNKKSDIATQSGFRTVIPLSGALDQRDDF